MSDSNNNIVSFNQGCHLTKLITENTYNYSLEIGQAYISSSINSKIDISNLNTNYTNKFIINIIFEDLKQKEIIFGSPKELTPNRVKEIFLYQENRFDDSYNRDFIYNFDDNNIKEFIIVEVILILMDQVLLYLKL